MNSLRLIGLAALLFCQVAAAEQATLGHDNSAQEELDRQYKEVGLPTGWTYPTGYKGSDPTMLFPVGTVEEGYTADYQRAVRSGKIDGRYGIKGEYHGLRILDKLKVPKRLQMKIGPAEFREIVRRAER